MFGKSIDCGPVGGQPLALAPFGKERLPRVIEWVNDQEITRYLGTDYGCSPEQELEWFDTTAKNPARCQWGIFWGERHIGNAGLDKISAVDRNAYYGILIGEKDCWGKGIATAVAVAVAEYAFTVLNLERIYANVFLPNEGSKRALEKAGFVGFGLRPGAKFAGGAYRDEWQACLEKGGR